MNEIAQMTYNQQDFVEIMEMLDKRLNDKGKNWRHVFKVRWSGHFPVEIEGGKLADKVVRGAPYLNVRSVRYCYIPARLPYQHCTEAAAIKASAHRPSGENFTSFTGL